MARLLLSVRGVSQEIVERILGRILTDARFRERVLAQPGTELGRLELLEHERESLGRLDRRAVSSLAETLDPRIVRG